MGRVLVQSARDEGSCIMEDLNKWAGGYYYWNYLVEGSLKAVYHRERLVKLNARQEPNHPQVRKQGHAVKLWEIREDMGQAIRGTRMLQE